MTLVELLVAASLVMVVLAVVGASLRTTMMVSARQAARSSEWSALETLRTLRADLRAAVALAPGEEMVFLLEQPHEGSSRLQWTAVDQAEAVESLELAPLVQLTCETEGGQAPFALRRSCRLRSGPESLREVSDRVLMRELRGFRAWALDGEEWVEQWRGEGLPRAVRLELVTASAEGLRTSRLDVALPGAWVVTSRVERSSRIR